MMTNLLRKLSFVFVLGLSVCANGADVDGVFDVMSAHIYRGTVYNDGFVMQPSLDLTSDQFRVNLWGNFDVSDFDDRVESYEFSEVRMELSFLIDSYDSQFQMGITEYLYGASPDPFGRSNTREVFADASYTLTEYVTVGGRFILDIDEIRDFRLEGRGEFACMFGGDVSLRLGAMIALCGEEMSAGEDGGAHDYRFYGNLSFALRSDCDLFLYVSHVGTMDEDVLPEPEVEQFGGAGLRFQL